MPTIKIENIVKDPKNLKAKPIDRNDPEIKKHLEEVRKQLSQDHKPDWKFLKQIRFDF